MQPKLEGVEIQSVRRGDHDFAIDDAPGRQAREKYVVQLGEVPIERAQVATLNEHVGSAAEDNGAKSIPFGLVEKLGTGREIVGELREHRFDRRLDAHPFTTNPFSSRSSRIRSRKSPWSSIAPSRTAPPV